MGQGTIVTIDLPELSAQYAAASEAPLSPRPVPRGSETILVVEDADIVRTWMCRVLGTLGYQIVEAQDGREALRLLEGGTAVDLVLSDVVMPNMGGRELGARIAKLRADLPVLFISGYSREEILGRGLLEKDARVLAKPFTDEMLGSTIRSVLAGKTTDRTA